MISVKDSVIPKIAFDKIAIYELPKNVAEWNEEILNQFFEQINYLPKEFGVDIIVKSVDENEGYAKGSIAVWYQGKQINFPVIVKNYQLSPFDVFVYKDGEETKYKIANLRNIKKVLSSEKMGVLEDKKGKGIPGVKSVGGVYPKTSIDISDTSELTKYPTFSKMSKWPLFVKMEDFEKLAVQLEAEPDIGKNFVDNTGDLISNIIELKKKRIVADDHKEGILDLKNVVKAKRAITVLDSQFFDVNDLQPITAPMVCELRLYEYPSLEDFIESGKSMAGRFLATMNGKPISGIVLDYKDKYSIKSGPIGEDSKELAENDNDIEKKRKLRNRRDQIFISLDGKYYSQFNDYDKHGIGFYGSRILSQDKALEKAVQLIAKNTTDEFSNINRDNRYDGSDKLFGPNKEMEQGKRDRYESGFAYGDNKLFAIFGMADAFECVEFSNNFKKFKVNDSHVYVSNDEAIIPANVAGLQKVKSVKDPVYKMVLGKVKNIFLIPEGSLIINGMLMRRINKDDLMRPSKPICKTYEDAAINKVALWVDGESGYKISGKPFEPFKKIARIDGSALTTNEAFMALQIMGMDSGIAKTAMQVALNRFADENVKDKSVSIFGVRDDYINTDVINELEKTARIRELFKDICQELRVDLIKEASALDDPEAVDVVLSLNFVNEDSLKNYIDNIEEMKKISDKLAELLVASRMGLSSIDEGAIKKSMEGLNSVIENLENIQMAVEE